MTPAGAQLTPDAIFAGEFRVLRPLSSGGMGSVYVVEQLKTGRQRALKLMHTDLAKNVDFRRRFEREARVSANIESEHVVEVISAGVDQQTGMPWLAMELLDGQDLAQLVEHRGRLPPAEVNEIFKQLCHAVGNAHAKNIVHRDLKPENIFLAKSRRPDVPFTVKVLDFGLAWCIAEAQSKATATGIGTPQWMAPEQSEFGRVVGVYTDVWALGLIAFYLLTGEYYWESARDTTSAATLLREVVMADLEPASTRARRYGRRCPPDFDGWFARCVVREPEKRFANASEAYAALAMVLGAPIRESLPDIEPNPQPTIARPPAPAPSSGTVQMLGPPPGVATDLSAMLAPAQIPSHPGLLPVPRKRLHMGCHVVLGVCGLAAAVALWSTVGFLRARSTKMACDDVTTSERLKQCQIACERDSAPHCTMAGDLVLQKGRQSADTAEAARNYQKGCDGKDAAGCEKLGSMYDPLFTGVFYDSPVADAAKALELYKKGCDSKLPRACAALGRLLTFGPRAMRQPAAAIEALNRACNDKEPSACVDLGRIYESGLGVSGNAERAKSLFEKAHIELLVRHGRGDTRATVELAWMLDHGKGAAVDKEKAKELYQKVCDGGPKEGMARACREFALKTEYAAERLKQACEAGDAEGCAELGWLHESGKGTSKDASRASELYVLSCRHGSATGCFRAGGASESGLAGAKDETQAVRYYSESCDTDHAAACSKLGDLRATGRGTAKDGEKAREAYARGCDLGDVQACTSLAELLAAGTSVAKDEKSALDAYEKACAQGSLAGCAYAGLYWDRGKGVDRDAIKAAERYTRACDSVADGTIFAVCGACVMACHNLGILRANGGTAKDQEDAFRCFKKACEAGVRPSCAIVGARFEKGLGTFTSAQSAISYYERACPDLALIEPDADACHRLGLAHKNGELGLKRDRAKAKDYLDRACKSGSSPLACAELGK